MIIPCTKNSTRVWLTAKPAARQQGVALITVLMVFAIATLLTAKIITTKSIDTQRISSMVNRTQAYYYALAAEDLAILALQKDKDDDVVNGPDGDDLTELWATGRPFEIDNIGSVYVKIVDLNRYYNINNMLQPSPNSQINKMELDRFTALLEALDINPSLAGNLQDWLDENSEVDGYASEGEDYERLTPGYLAANRLVADVSELRLINEFSPEVMQKLLPHITAINRYGVVPINPNTATEYALMTLLDSSHKGISQSIAQDIQSNRSYPTDSDFISALGSGTTLTSSILPNLGSTVTGYNTKIYQTTSNYYELNIRASYAGHVAYLTSVVYMTVSGSNAEFVVLSRKETDNSNRLIQ